MSRTEILLLLDDLFELSPGSLKGNEQLEDLESWDSLAALSFIVLVDEHFNLIIDPKKLEVCISIDDLINLIGDAIQ